MSEGVFDLAGVHVLPAGDDHLVVASVDEKPSAGIEMADVTGRHQAPIDSLVPPPV